MMTRDEVSETLKGYLVEMFEVEPDRVTPSARLQEDLDLDSIDAVDLIVRLQNLTGKKITPEAFKTVRTVDDVVDRVHELVSE
jgi:acyl carrier protein